MDALAGLIAAAEKAASLSQSGRREIRLLMLKDGVEIIGRSVDGFGATTHSYTALVTWERISKAMLNPVHMEVVSAFRALEDAKM